MSKKSDAKGAMLLPYLHYTSNVTDRLVSGEPPKSIEQKREDLDRLVKQLNAASPGKLREKL
jgi:hypothetical protein